MGPGRWPRSLGFPTLTYVSANFGPIVDIPLLNGICYTKRKYVGMSQQIGAGNRVVAMIDAVQTL